ncbi:MAG: GrpB family protein [Chloroflexota bacterium]
MIDRELSIRGILEGGRLLNSDGHPEEARPAFETAFAAATEAGFEHLAIDALHMVAMVAPASEQEALNRRALELAAAAADPRAQRWRASLLNNLGWSAFERSEFAAALELFEEALDERIAQGQPAEILIARWCIGRTLRALGRVHDALAMQRSLAHEHEQAGTSDPFVEEEIRECLAALSDAPALRSDEELASVRIGPAEVLDSQITLSEYDTHWPALFEREASRIRAVLGDAALLIEHVGSTSVPGLVAKPRIDIVLAVADSSAEAAYVPPMEAAGYVLRIREPEWYEHRLFKGPDTDVNLHVFSAGCPEIQRMLRFRDHLRSNPEDCTLYETTKRELASRTWKYTQHYADAKTKVVEAIMARAMAD